MLNQSKLRKGDEDGEKEVGIYLDEKFYQIYVTNFNSIDDIKAQISGVDTTFILDDKSIICDEKVALNYINKPLNSFSLELMFTNRAGKRNIGWFVDKEKVTTHYLLCYITKCDVDRLPKKCDIKEMEIILISKKSLLEFLNRNGYDYDTLTRKALNIYEGKDKYFGNMYEDGYKFSKSDKFVESPVNILVKKDVLIRLSTKHIII